MMSNALMALGAAQIQHALSASTSMDGPTYPTHCLAVSSRLPLSSSIHAGASGDLAKKKTYPALFFLFQHGFLCEHVEIIGYARSKLTDAELRDHLRPFIKDKDTTRVNAFLELCTYVSGPYDGDRGWSALAKCLREREAGYESVPVGRLFYLALPPSVYPDACLGIRQNCDNLERAAPGSWARVVVEKPFGKDLDSSEDLAERLGKLFSEDRLYRIDHYLGKVRDADGE